MILYQSKYSVISLDEKLGLIKLLWSDDTLDMKDDDFKETSEVFAEEAEKRNARRLLVDVKNFKFPRATEPTLAEWRIRTIIPKYNNAGVRKFAFVHGDGFKEPDFSGRPVDGQNFITRHLGSEQEAKAWLLMP
jgi:hypothetical protein